MNNNLKHNTTKIRIYRFLWGSIPYLLLILIISISVFFYFRIENRIESNKEQKKTQVIKKRPPVNVVTMKLNPMLIRDKISLPGITTPWVKLDILAEVRGRVIKKLVKEGDRVKKGQVLLILDSRDYKNAYKSVKASYDAALSSLKRLQKLYYEQLSTQSQLDEALAQSEALKSDMDSARLNVERSNIKAPISGIINCSCVDVGKYINVSDKVSEILQYDRIKVSVGIPESDVDAVRKLNTFQVEIDALNKKTFQGKKYFLSKTADSDARLYNLDIIIDNFSFDILPDMFARVEIIKREVTNGISVPLYAVISRDKKQYVFIVDKEEKAFSKKIYLGLQEEWRVEVTEGLKVGDEVIVVGQRNLNNGQKVNVIKKIRNIKELDN